MSQPDRTFIIYGTPGPQGSKKFVGLSKAGRGILVESSAKVKPWREAVKAAVVGYPVLDGAIRAQMIFTLRKPASAPKRLVTWPDRKPDLSKLIRSTEDALSDSGAYEDDARIIDVIGGKRFPGEGDGALDRPGCVIKLWRVKTKG